MTVTEMGLTGLKHATMDGGVDLDRIGIPTATHRAEQLLSVISDVDAGTTGTDRRRH